MLTAVSVLVIALSMTSTASAATPAEVIAVAPNDSAATIIANAANVVPSARQLAWERAERMDAYGQGTANGTKIIIWTCHGGTNQKWQLH
jgi:hypothetical protein